jgi:Putative transposase
VSGPEFVGGFVQHVLPSRLQKIRYYGWMSPNSRIDAREVRWLVAIAMVWMFTLTLVDAKPSVPTRPKPRCHQCDGDLVTVLVTDWQGKAVYIRPPPYRDTG